MAEAAATPEMNKGGSFTGESGDHVEELAKNLGGALKLGKGDHGSDLAPQSRAAVTSPDPVVNPQNKQEGMDGTDLGAQARSTEEGIEGLGSSPGKPDDAAKKPKKKKKKKSRPTGSLPGNQSGDPGLEAPGIKHTQSRDPGREAPARKHTAQSSPVGNEDSGWTVAGPRRSRGEPAMAGAVNVSGTPPSPNGKWAESAAMEVNSNLDSGWEVAGSRSRRGPKKWEDGSAKSPGGPSAGWKTKGGGGQQFQRTPSNEYNQGAAKQRSGDWGTVNRGARPEDRYGAQEKLSPSKNYPPPSKLGGARQGPATKSNSGAHSGEPAVRGPSNVYSGSSVDSATILGKLLPQTVKAVPELSQRVDDASDIWTPDGVYDKYPPPSVYSDSQCSDDDSDIMSLSSSDSEGSHKSHSTQKKNKCFRNFFQQFDLLTEEQLLHDHECQWHCPPCHGGVGAIDWYTGLQPLLNHAKTIRSRKVKLHKLFAEVLEEEIRIRGAAPGTGGSGKYGKWRGLGDENELREIVWPPMVVICNTQLDKDDDDKWIGMGNEELLDLFKKHNPVKARHAYGPQGHRGVSILVFVESPMGCYCAHLLEQAFKDVRRGKDNWGTPGKSLFYPGGDRILYGYIATAEDLNYFNKHSKGKQILKWELRSFQDVVRSQIRRQDEENSLVMTMQEELQKVTAENKVLTKSVWEVSKRLGLREDEVKSIMNKVRDQDEERKTEMDDLETMYKEAFQNFKQEIQELEEKQIEMSHRETLLKEEIQKLKQGTVDLD